MKAIVNVDKNWGIGIGNSLLNHLSPDMKFFEAKTGKEAIAIVENEDVHLILLDIMMPVMDGITAAAKIRETSNVPIIFLSAKSEDSDKILGLNIGADDYITKPYSVRELMARVKANLRRNISEAFALSEDESNIIKMGRLVINSERYEVTKDGNPIDLTRREFELLEYLAKKPEKTSISSFFACV